MDRTIVVDSAAAVRAAIARVIIGAHSPDPLLGTIELKSHQLSSIARLESALVELGGALLCDEVGMGKTFVALAIARRYSRVVVLAPAGLREMWRDALARTGVRAEFVAIEKLSRTEPAPLMPDLLIIDEAHHVRNPGTRRYGRVARLARDARVLLLTATPVHNRRNDLVALLSLFLGSAAKDFPEHGISRCVVRRQRREMLEIAGIPEIEPVVACDVPDDPDLVTRLLSLPPPLPPRDGDSGGALINRGLVHQWSSSDSALRDAMRRRLAKAEVLTASLRAGRYPNALELEAWTFADGTLQLGFVELLAPATPEPDALLQSVSSHARALESFLGDYAQASMIDEAKADALRRIREENPRARIVAFAQYASTVSALFRSLSPSGGVAALTASCARVAGGRLSRTDAIARFAPRANRARSPSRAEAIDLLLTTDLLSEGVNLQDAEIVVHLDIPWTAARLEQRVGRVARMGSVHSRVRIYQFRPPASAERILHGVALVSSKWEIARQAIGANAIHPVAGRDYTESAPSSIPSRTERLRAIIGPWLHADPGGVKSGAGAFVAAVNAGRMGFVAAAYLGSAPLLLCSDGNAVSIELDAQIEACLLAEGKATHADPHEYAVVYRELDKWIACNEAMHSAGAMSAPPGLNKRLLRRIDATLQRAPPHVRASRARVAATARTFASGSHSAAIESELEELASSPLSEDEWLAAIASLAKTKQARERVRDFRLRAVLLLKP